MPKVFKICLSLGSPRIGKSDWGIGALHKGTWMKDMWGRPFSLPSLSRNVPGRPLYPEELLFPSHTPTTGLGADPE